MVRPWYPCAWTLLALVGLIVGIPSCARVPLAPPAPEVQPAVRVSSEAVIRFDERSEFERVLVVDQEGYRYLRFGGPNGDDQTMVSLGDPSAVPMDYIQLASLGLALAPSVSRVLAIGLGGGAFPTLVRRAVPEATVDGVELDPVVAQVAQEFFGLTPDPYLNVIIEDGALFVQGDHHPYDVIFLDAYTAGGIPEDLSTVEFFTHVARLLTPGGAVVLNVSLEGDSEKKVRGRFREVFGDVGCIRTHDDLNLVLFASPGLTPGRLVSRARRFTRGRVLPYDLILHARRLTAPCDS